MPDYTTSTSYDDAKGLWESEHRFITGDLPLPTLLRDIANESLWVTPTQRLEVLETGFLSVFIYSTVNDDPPDAVATLSLPVEGYDNLLDYLYHHPELPIVISIMDNRYHWQAILPSSYGYYWSPYIDNGKRSDCINIGWEVNPAPGPDPAAPPAVTWNQPVGTPPPEEFKDYKLRYLTSDTGNISDAETTLDFRLGDHDDGPSYLPMHSDTIPFWSKSIELAYDHFTKRWVDLLETKNLYPSGFFLDAEDFPAPPEDDAVTKSKMSADYRFYENLAEGDYYSLNAAGIREINDARAQICFDVFPCWQNDYSSPVSWQQDYSVFYGFRSASYYGTGFPDNRAFWKNGRRVSSISVYPYYSGTPNLYYAMFSLGGIVRDMAAYDIHLFHGWLSAGLSSPGLSISDMIMFTKLYMFCGAYKVWDYSIFITEVLLKHHPWSLIIAYNEMQQYADFILEGENFIPSADVSRVQHYWSGSADVSRKFVYTHFYDSNSHGDLLDPNLWICCRTLPTETMIFAATSDRTYKTSAIIAPTGDEVVVDASPYGEITII